MSVVETRSGRLDGVELAGAEVFRGIPFARPPTGELRFRAPQPAEPWAGVRPADRFGWAAPQHASVLPHRPLLDGGETSEDCLYLNVWTPRADAGRRPVLVWIHGGALILCSGSMPLFDGSALAKRGDVVVVTLNYRLGALGFLHLADVLGEDFASDANCGHLDQIAALEWVRDNIAAFGGDPSNVTVFGESAGAMSIAALLAMPRARPLFRRAILQSGAANLTQTREMASEVAKQFVEAAEIDVASAGKLREVPAEHILGIQARVQLERAAQRQLMTYQTVVDGSLLPRAPLESLADGEARDIPLLGGTTLEEWAFFASMDPTAATVDEAGLRERIARTLFASDDPEQSAGELVDFYAARRPGATPPELQTAIVSDLTFRAPLMRLLELQSAHQSSTYAYLFTWQKTPFGAGHLMDVPFVFGSYADPGVASYVQGGPEVDALAARMQDAWLAFARADDPSHDTLPPWPGYDASRRATMLLGETCEVHDAPYEEEQRACDERM